MIHGARPAYSSVAGPNTGITPTPLETEITLQLLLRRLREAPGPMPCLFDITLKCRGPDLHAATVIALRTPRRVPPKSCDPVVRCRAPAAEDKAWRFPSHEKM